MDTMMSKKPIGNTYLIYQSKNCIRRKVEILLKLYTYLKVINFFFFFLVILFGMFKR